MLYTHEEPEKVDLIVVVRTQVDEALLLEQHVTVVNNVHLLVIVCTVLLVEEVSQSICREEKQ